MGLATGSGWESGIRTFTDADGAAWEVWEAHPQLEERRRLRDRRGGQRPTDDRRSSPADARQRTIDTAGWLVFRSLVGTRRRHPIPDGWAMFSDEALRRLLSSGRLTGPFPRPKIL